MPPTNDYYDDARKRVEERGDKDMVKDAFQKRRDAEEYVRLLSDGNATIDRPKVKKLEQKKVINNHLFYIMLNIPFG